MKFAILVAALFITSVYAVTERCRKTPVPQWYGTVFESNHEATGAEPALRRARLYYDATNKRVNITEVELFEPGNRTYRVGELYLHETNMKYRIDLTTGRCESSPLTTAFVPFGVPSGATFNNIDYLGAELAGLGLKVDSFNEKTESGGSYFGFWAPVSSSTNPDEDAGCVPIIETYRDRPSAVPGRTNIHATFEDIVPVAGTSQFPTNTFTVPAACRSRRN